MLFYQRWEGRATYWYWRSIPQEYLSTPQRPLFWNDLRRRLTEAGLTDIMAYGNLAGESFDTDHSPDLMITAIKRRR